MAKKQNILTSFKPQNYSGFVQSTLALERAKAQDPMAGARAFATPILAEISRQVQVSEDAKNTFLENMPDDFQVELVSPELKAELSNQLRAYKSEYLEGVELLSKHANNPNSEEYRRGVEITEGAKNKMMNTYNGLVKFQQDRTYEINNANTRGWSNDPTDNIMANKLVVGLNADQVSYDEQGNPIYDAGIGKPINVFDYKRTRTRDLDMSNALFNTIEVNSYKSGTQNMNKDLFNRTIDNQLAAIRMNPASADELFYIGVDGDMTGQTAPKTYIKDWDGLPPSKSPETMQKMLAHLKSTADLRYNDGLNDRRREETTVDFKYNANFDAQSKSGAEVVSHPTIYGQFLVKGDGNLYYQVSNPSISKEELEVKQGFPIDVWRSSFGLSNQGLVTDPIKTPENPLLNTIFIKDKSPKTAISRLTSQLLNAFSKRAALFGAGSGVEFDTERTSWKKQEDGTWNVQLAFGTGGNMVTKDIKGVTEDDIKAAKQQDTTLSDEAALIIAAQSKLQ